MCSRGSLSVVLAALALALGCSRTSPTPAPAPVAPPAQAAELKDAGSTLRLATAVEGEADAGAPAPAPLAGKVVLHVGDSMVGGDWGLTAALKAKFVKEGATFIRDYKVSETIKSYDKSSRLKDLLAQHDPDIVIITLGTNDATLPNPTVMAPYVESIAKKIGTRECWWMGPPLWKPDTGIIATIRDHSAPCHFYDASKLKVQRGEDGIHPTDRGAQTWANAFWAVFRAPHPPASAPFADAGAP
jgi:hypothetical protein